MTKDDQNRMDPANSLSDERFCALLMEQAVAADETAEVAQMKDALAGYRTETLAWAEQRSAAQPSLAAAARRERIWAAAPQWALAAVAVMTVSIGVMHFTGNTDDGAAAGAEPEVMVQNTTSASPQQQIVDDNVLLQSIDSALSTGSGLPVDALGLQHVHHAGTQQDGSAE